jgi:hypothetical protein
MPAIDDDFTVTIGGKYTIIRFATLLGNDTIFPNANMSVVIARAINDEVVFATGTIELTLDYTRDTGDASVSIDAYINDILSRIRIQDVLVNNSADIANGDINGAGSANRFGRNNSIGTGTVPEDVWFGGDVYTGVDATGPEILDIVSSSTSDDVGGVGALTIRIFGLKTATSTFYEEEDIILLGTGTANSIDSWYRVNKAEILTAGSTGNNVGNITISQTTSGIIFAVMPATFNQTAIASYTVPAATTGFMVKFTMRIVRASGAAGSAVVSLRVRDTASSGVFVAKGIVDAQTGGDFSELFPYPIPLPAGADVLIRCDDVSDNATAISAGFSIFLLDD